MSDTPPPDDHGPRRRSLRLRDYDHSQEGAYFVTVCVGGGMMLFGTVIGEEMMPTEAGRIIGEEIRKTPSVRPNVVLDCCVVMPNHVHVVLLIQERGRRRTPRTTGVALESPSQTIGAIVRGIKASTTSRIRRLPDYSENLQV